MGGWQVDFWSGLTCYVQCGWKWGYLKQESSWERMVTFQGPLWDQKEIGVVQLLSRGPPKWMNRASPGSEGVGRSPYLKKWGRKLTRRITWCVNCSLHLHRGPAFHAARNTRPVCHTLHARPAGSPPERGSRFSSSLALWLWPSHFISGSQYLYLRNGGKNGIYPFKF